MTPAFFCPNQKVSVLWSLRVEKSLNVVLCNIRKHIQTFTILTRSGLETPQRTRSAVIGISLAHCVGAVRSRGEDIGEVKVGRRRATLGRSRSGRLNREVQDERTDRECN